MTAITIPPAALEVGVRAAIAQDSGPEGSALFAIHWKEFSDAYRDNLRAAFLAMIEAWPGMQSGSDDGGMTLSGIYLPIPQDSSDDQ